jgi:sn-glycerol 3-phosphate transport system ATP-binding protein
MRPATGFVARFVGTPSMNLLAIEGPMAAALESAAPVLGLPALPRGGHLGVRPESIHLADFGLPAVVSTVEYLGADSIVLCEASGQRVALRVDGATDLTSGCPVRLSWRSEDTHLFGADDRRLAPEHLEFAA